MKTLTVPEAKERLPEIIAEVNRGEVIILQDGDQRVALSPCGVEEEFDFDPSFEQELLKTADGPFLPYSREEMRALVEKAIAEHARK